MKSFLTLFAGTLLCATIAHGQVVKNGDFSTGRSHWEGVGQVVVLDQDQKAAAADAGGISQLQVVLSKNVVQETKQRLIFKADENTGDARVTVVLKTSPDFIRNDKCPVFNIKFDRSGCYSMPSLVFPNVDLCLRMDSDRHYYIPRTLKAGGDWQTITGHFKKLGNPTGKTLSLVFPAGTGTIWVKSVSVEPQ